MYTYEYESITFSMENFTAFTLDADHRQMIEQRAQAGWRYVGYLPVKLVGYGQMKKIDLIFEKEV